MMNPRKILTHPIHLLAFGFGSGLAPKGPGTFGTLVGVVLYLLMAHLSFVYYIFLTIILTVFAIGLCDWSSKKLGVHDYPGIVADEIVGFLWVMLGVPIHWWTVLLGFLLFRLFDIWKPWPIRWFDQHVKGGFGIVLDDLLAALYAWILLQFIFILIVRGTL